MSEIKTLPGISGAEHTLCDSVAREQLTTLQDVVDTLNEGGLDIKDEYIAEQVYAWLDEHQYVNKITADKFVQNNDYAVSVMGDTALSYIRYSNQEADTSTEFFYDTSGRYNNWGDKAHETVSGKHGITCSPFVMDLLFGVKYENSKYNNSSNQLEESMLRDIGLIDYFYPPNVGSTYLADYAISNGYAFYPEENLSNVRPGDVLFTTQDAASGNLLGIGHCEVVGYWVNDNRFVVWQAGSVPRINVRTASEYASRVVLCARFPFASASMPLANIVKYNEADVPHTVNNSSEIAVYNLSETIKAYTYYTAIFKLTNTNTIADQYPSIRGNNDNVLTKTYSGATNKPSDDIYRLPFYSPVDINSIKLMMIKADSGVEFGTVNVEWMCVVKGIITSPTNYIPPQYDVIENNSSVLADVTVTTFTPSAGAEYATFGGCYYYKLGTRVHVHIGVSGLTANTTVQNFFTLPSGYRPKSDVIGLGQGDSFTNESKIGIAAASGIIKIRSAATYALIDVDFDAFG